MAMTRISDARDWVTQNSIETVRRLPKANHSNMIAATPDPMSRKSRLRSTGWSEEVGVLELFFTVSHSASPLPFPLASCYEMSPKRRGNEHE